MKNKFIIFILITVIISFWAGYNFKAWQYDDICLDMGGGKNPENHDICIIKK